MNKRGLHVAGAMLIALVSALALAGPASAAHKNGVVESGEFGLYYSPNRGGPVFDLYYDDDNFAGENFPGTSTPANDNTASYWNRDSFIWHVYTNAGYTGSHGCLDPGYIGNASTTFRNRISSAQFLSSSC